MSESIPEVSIATTQHHRQHAQAIWTVLGETTPAPKAQIARAIAVVGLDVVQAVLAEAHQVEAQGGMLRKDGERRTLGGVFFALLKTRCTREQFQSIFWPKPLRKTSPATPVDTPPPPSAQALQIAGVIVEKLKLSQRKQTPIARDVERVGVPAALAALRTTMKIEQQGGRMDADGKRMKPLHLWRAALKVAPEQSVKQAA